MTARALFVAADGRLHAPWRILIFLVVAFLCITIVAIPVGPLYRASKPFPGADLAAQTLVLITASLAAHAIMLRWIDKQPWSYVGLHAPAARPIVLVRSWLIGAIPIAVPALLLLAAGWLAIRPAPDGSWWLAAALVSLILLFAALAEELLSRGYVFAALREWLGCGVALLLTSAAFGLLHLGNKGADARSMTTVILAGLFLGAVLIVTRSLYAAWMAHFAWNWVMAVPLHVPVSGVPFPSPDYQIVDAGPDWLTGGIWGPEGGAGAAVGMITGLGYLYWRGKRKHEQLEG